MPAKEIKSLRNLVPGIPNYVLKEDEKRFFALLPTNFSPENWEWAQRVYAGVIAVNQPGAGEKYYSGKDEDGEWRKAINELVAFVHTCYETDAGWEIYKMFDLTNGKNYLWECWELFLAERDLIETEKLKKIKKDEVRKISEYVSKINTHSKLYSIYWKADHIKERNEKINERERAIEREITTVYQINHSEEIKAKIPVVTMVVSIPGAENTMIKFTDWHGFAFQFAGIFKMCDPEKFEQALRENSGPGQFFENLMEKLDDEHFCYLRLDKGETLPTDRTKLAEVMRIFKKIREQKGEVFVDWLSKKLQKISLKFCC